MGNLYFLGGKEIPLHLLCDEMDVSLPRSSTHTQYIDGQLIFSDSPNAIPQRDSSAMC